MNFEWIDKIKSSRVFAIFCILLGTLFSGTIVVYKFQKGEFFTTSPITIVLLSFSITAPTFIFNFFIDCLWGKPVVTNDFEEDLEYRLITAGGLNAVGIYISLLSTYYINKGMKFFIFILVLINIMYAVISFISKNIFPHILISIKKIFYSKESND
jgi:hypothetical protein